ncbi:uncharacterized protein LOC143633352 [Bidens hawaiensis]|uniref:uncharacterized protein LOC143633352 n=1 Tax=Bidens hawaiensis TaxID=980011 RepID=UPI004049682E
MSHITQFQHLKIQLEAIQSATNNFSIDNWIGQGGYGKVYKGKLILSMGETMVALKRLNREFRQGEIEFWKEIMTLSFYKHENIVSLLGYCDDHGEKILVYEYVPKRSLDFYLTSDDLTWVQRLKICVGAARGIEYLHTPGETHLRILHRDIKSSNILLDSNWNAKISDFGLSKFAPANNHFTYAISNPVGTLGYIDPIYQEIGLLTKESDVYSFGVVLFEVLCGRLSFTKTNIRPLIGLVRECYEHNKLRDIVYSTIKDEINEPSLKLFVDIAYQCLKRKREERPSMAQIVTALESAIETQEKADAEAKAKAIKRAGILNVKVLRTTDVGRENTFDASNLYFILYIDYGNELYEPVNEWYNKVNKEWNEDSTMYVENFDAQVLSIIVTEVESLEKHRQLGTTSIKLTDLTPEIPLICNLPVQDKKCLGHIKVEMLYEPSPYGVIKAIIEDVLSLVQKAPEGTPKDGGLLVVIIHQALLTDKKYHHSAVTLRLHGELRRTPSMMNTSYPRWGQEFTFMLERPPTDENLHLEVVDKSKSFIGLIPGMGSLGSININLASVVTKKRTNELYQLEPSYGSSRRNFLQVELRWRTTD